MDMDRPFLQTPEWLGFQRFLGRKVWRLDDGFIKTNVVRHDGSWKQNYLYVPYGPELNLELAKTGIANDISHFLRHLRHLAHQEGSIFVRLEPTHDVVIELLMRNGAKLRRARRSVQPRATVVMDLTKTEEQMFDGLHHKHRYNINLAERKGVTIGESDDIEAFWKLLAKTSEHDGFSTHDRLYYKKLLNYFSAADGAIRTRLFLAYYGGQPVAGVLMLEHAKTVYYLHGAMDREQRALMAPQLLHWLLIRRYKQQGFHWYDFWGIDAGAYPGVTRFKLGFGGQTVEYPGAFDMVTRPWRYRLYKLLGR